MENSKIAEQQKLVEQVHAKVAKLVSNLKISGEVKSEFRVQVEQYENLFASLEQMKALTSDEKSIENLENQQLKVLAERVQWEVDYAHRIAE